MADAANWREICQPFDAIEIFPLKEAAAEKYEFLNAEELMKKFPLLIDSIFRAKKLKVQSHTK